MDAWIVVVLITIAIGIEIWHRLTIYFRSNENNGDERVAIIANYERLENENPVHDENEQVERIITVQMEQPEGLASRISYTTDEEHSGNTKKEVKSAKRNRTRAQSRK